MRQFGIIANRGKCNAQSLAMNIQEYLNNKDCQCYILPDKNEVVESEACYTSPANVPNGIECVIVLGGDGTMINAATDLAEYNIPLYGINLGGVGFLTESDTDTMWSDIDNLINGSYRVEKRMMLKGYGESKGAKYSTRALNDIVISKRELGKLIRFEVYINDVLLDTFMADGIIISTPTGSTGYNLSAGGPVIAPRMEAISVTPVCPHSLNDRSFVIGGENRINIRLMEGKNFDNDSALVIADGRVVSKIISGDTVYIAKDTISTDIIMMEKTNFYQRMRTKLN